MSDTANSPIITDTPSGSGIPVIIKEGYFCLFYIKFSGTRHKSVAFDSASGLPPFDSCSQENPVFFKAHNNTGTEPITVYLTPFIMSSACGASDSAIAIALPLERQSHSECPDNGLYFSIWRPVDEEFWDDQISITLVIQVGVDPLA